MEGRWLPGAGVLGVGVTSSLASTDFSTGLERLGRGRADTNRSLNRAHGGRVLNPGVALRTTHEGGGDEHTREQNVESKGTEQAWAKAVRCASVGDLCSRQGVHALAEVRMTGAG